MEEHNDNVPAGPEPGQPETPPPAPAPSQPQKPPEHRHRGSAFWLKVVAFLYAISLAAAFSVIAKGDTARKSRPKDLELSKLTGLSKKDSVAVIPIYGVITQGKTSHSWDRGSQQIAKRIKKMAAKKEVRAIVLDINSPGGTVGAVQEIHSAILKAKASEKKPFVARFGEVSASGGYYVAAPCDAIYSHPGTITGSIGVIFSVSNFEGLMKKVGYRNEAIKSGKYKDIGSAMRTMTAEERRLLQGMIDDSYDQFVGAVAAGRKMKLEDVRELADGRIYTGRQAKETGLVDELGDLQDAIDAAGEMAKLGKNPRVITDDDPFESIFSLLELKLAGPGAAVAKAVEVSPKLEYRWDGR